MSKLFRNIAFSLGFFVTVLIFLFTNIYSVLPPRRADQVCFDCYETFGFPFAFYESGTSLHLSHFIWAGVVANISIALSVGFIIAYIFKFVWSKVTTQKLK